MKPLIVLFVPVAIAAALFALSCASRRQPRTGLANGKLKPCPGSPNCVSSEDESGRFFVEPLGLKGSTEVAWDLLKSAIKEMGGQIEQDTGDYLWATFRSKVFRFVDDLECRMDIDNEVIHVRSASRVGHSDLGVNRKRIEALRLKMSQKSQSRGGAK